jgi:release factor glutamine methyltransferase
VKISEVLSQLQFQCQGDLPEAEVQIILAHVLGRPRTWLLAHMETSIQTDQLRQAEVDLARLRSGIPLPYILGHWEFYGMDFEVTKDVLIPRPETELLVEKAIGWLNASPLRRTVADIGTGSGVISVTLAAHIPDLQILATDISLEALKVARHNACKFSVQNHIDFLQCDLLPHHIDPLPTERHFDLICGNLPYIPTEKLHALPIFGREPSVAVDGGPDGLELYRRLFELTPAWLAPRGLMLFEIEATLGPQALSLAFDAFSEDVTLHLHQDLAGNDRLLEIQLR